MLSAKTVANNANVSVSRTIVSSPGRNVLKFWRVDQGVVLQKLVMWIVAMLMSYLGPLESAFQTIGN